MLIWRGDKGNSASRDNLIVANVRETFETTDHLSVEMKIYTKKTKLAPTGERETESVKLSLFTCKTIRRLRRELVGFF